MFCTCVGILESGIFKPQLSRWCLQVTTQVKAVIKIYIIQCLFFTVNGSHPTVKPRACVLYLFDTSDIDC